MPRALITGITGQDGSYLAELLLSKDYEVYGLVRRTSLLNTDRIDHLLDSINILYGDITDMGSLVRAVETSQPDEVYNLAAFSHVGASFDSPIACFEQTALGAMKLLETVRLVKPDTKYYQASSSEMFGYVRGQCTEKTPFHPHSPYGVAKLAAHSATVNYREAYGMFCCCGILFNHESPRRGDDFVTKKIARGAASREHITLGNLKAYRDWGYAYEYVEAMYLMMQHHTPGDYIIATGEIHSVMDFCIAAYGEYWQDYVSTSSEYVRPLDIQSLCGDSSKARNILGWHPKVAFRDLVRLMVQAEREKINET